MEERSIGRLGRDVGVIGLGTWQLGADWGEVADDTARSVLEAAVGHGVTFFDTADVYGDGRSERFCGELRHRHPEVFVATKMGRRVEQLPENYDRESFLAWNDRSRANLGTDRLELVQLHCPPDAVYDEDSVFEALDDMVGSGRISAYGVSVETCDQALRSIARSGVSTVQIILNCFRLKPLEEVLPAARETGVGIIARVPLASGLLSGRYDEHTSFGPNDHRNFNRHGEAFDVGETFAGVPYDVGVQAARELGALVDPGMTLAQLALRWILDQPGVSTLIPGARNVDQVAQNVSAAGLPPLRTEQLDHVREVYDRLIRPHVHDRW